MKMFFRFFKTHIGTSFVTIFGFAAGLAAAILLMIFIHQELSFDDFWKNGDRIYRVQTVINDSNRQRSFSICLRRAYTEVPGQVPGIKTAVQIYRTFDPEIKYQQTRFRNLRMLYVDSTFFKVFQLQSLAGDTRGSLARPDAIVITKSTAAKVFGAKDPVGQLVPVTEYSLEGREQLFRVAAVVPDLPQTTHFNFDVLLPMSAVKNIDHLGGLEFYTYYLLHDRVPAKATVSRIIDSYTGILQSWLKDIGNSGTAEAPVIPLKDIYLYSGTSGELGPSGDLQTIRIFALLTVLILVIAITNFVNIFLVQGGHRAMETGIRKTLGANRLQLAAYFIKDAFLMTGISFLLALIIVTMLLNPFASLVNRVLPFNTVFYFSFLMVMLGVFLLTALLAGAYPAWYLAKQQPLNVLSGVTKTGTPKPQLRKAIVLAQFAICMFLLSNLVILQQQYNYMNSRPLGFDAKNVVAFRNLSPAIQKAYPLIKNDLMHLPGVTSVSGSHSRPGQGASGQGIKRFSAPDNISVSVREVRIQPDFFETYGMSLHSGRDFITDRPGDRNAIILNETAVKSLDLKEPLGSQVVLFNEPMEVIGVVDDYHYASLRSPIGPEIFTYYQDQVFILSVRINDRTGSDITEQIGAILQKYDAQYTADFVFLDDAFIAMYGGEQKLIQLVRAGSVLALLLTILGLASITAISIQQRTKEIGIRKTIGATSYQIVRMLISSQIKRLLATTVVAGFAAFWVIRQWLESYAYRVEISSWVFLGSGLLILCVALLVTAVISYRAALANPVRSLRYE